MCSRLVFSMLCDFHRAVTDKQITLRKTLSTSTATMMNDHEVGVCVHARAHARVHHRSAFFSGYMDGTMKIGDASRNGNSVDLTLPRGSVDVAESEERCGPPD